MTLTAIVRIAEAIQRTRYPNAVAMFAAGSIIRGEGTAHSDLDLVAIVPSLTQAFRESFMVGTLPVEAFVHDPETLEYFSMEVDRASGVPALPQMITEGIEIPAATDVSTRVKHRAAEILAMGPPPLDEKGERERRYGITDLLDDLRDARSQDERVATAAVLYERLADYHLRRLGLWSASGKAIPRVLRRTDPALCERYIRSFARLFAREGADEVIRLGEELLAPAGGLLFDGYRGDAPATWRRAVEGE